jgi:hypothetical protein
MKSRKSRRRQLRKFFLEERPPRIQRRKDNEAARVLQVLAEIGNQSPEEGDRKI